MTYGFKITNVDNEVVVDQDYQALMVTDRFTLSSVASVLLGYNFFQLPVDPTAVYFFGSIDVGDTLLGTAPLYLNGAWRECIGTNKNSLNVIAAKPMGDISYTPSGYGVVVYDGFGNVTYTADRSLVQVKDRFTVPFKSSVAISDTGNYFSAGSRVYAIAGSYGGGYGSTFFTHGFRKEASSLVSVADVRTSFILDPRVGFTDTDLTTVGVLSV